VTEVTSRTTKVLVSTIVAVRTFSSVSWRTGVLLPWWPAPVKNSRSGESSSSSSSLQWLSDEGRSVSEWVSECHVPADKQPMIYRRLTTTTKVTRQLHVRRCTSEVNSDAAAAEHFQTTSSPPHHYRHRTMTSPDRQATYIHTYVNEFITCNSQAKLEPEASSMSSSPSPSRQQQQKQHYWVMR